MSPVVGRGLRDLAIFVGVIGACYLVLFLFGARPGMSLFTVSLAVALGMGLRIARRELRYRKDIKKSRGIEEA
ncbi:hypothetical protein Pa4123_04780 [Phytohabitans aurantiacus]|uniref:DUF4229 domain-containing protein n=1 Tax=Phytohabitans aurantiacus TaxID=3016789 RepID=A0ABQ5QMU7_9ACTN|nr:hypothetical protein Pa4123_04780 [Phytohabitans aurantiacus]